MDPLTLQAGYEAQMQLLQTAADMAQRDARYWKERFAAAYTQLRKAEMDNLTLRQRLEAAGLSLDDDDDEAECPQCLGTGEGQHEGAACPCMSRL